MAKRIDTIGTDPISKDKIGIPLIKALAGDWDRTLIGLFDKYSKEKELKERQRLEIVIEADLKKVEQKISQPVADYYRSIYRFCKEYVANNHD